MKRSVEKTFMDALAKKHLCYVLITCNAPSQDGQLEVEMSYEGDASLAAYLLQGAQTFIDQQDQGDEFECPSPCQIYNIK